MNNTVGRLYTLNVYYTWYALLSATLTQIYKGVLWFGDARLISSYTTKEPTYEFFIFYFFNVHALRAIEALSPELRGDFCADWASDLEDLPRRAVWFLVATLYLLPANKGRVMDFLSTARADE